MTATIVEAALRALLFAVGVGVGLRVLRVSNVPVRKAAWSMVLVASLAMPFVMRWTATASWANRFGVALAWPTKRAVVEPTPPQAQPLPRVILASDSSQDVVPAATRVKRAPAAVPAAPEVMAVDIPAATPAAPIPARKQIHLPPAKTLVVWFYLAVSGLLLLRLLWGLGMAIRIWATAELVSPLVAPEPNVRASAKIPSPVTIGSGIVLPADYLEWDRSKLRMVLAHERSHVRQTDFYLQLLAGLYTALFWFSPLGWWLRRTLQTLGEAIGDRAGLDAAASRSRYAELLLEFAAMPRQALRRTYFGVAMARPGNLSHRIERMLNDRLFHNAFAEGRRRALVSLLLIPAALFGATALIRVAKAQAAPPVAPVPPRIALAPASPVLPLVLPDVAPAAKMIPDSMAPLMALKEPDDQAAPQPPQAPPPPPPAALGEGRSTGVEVSGGDGTVSATLANGDGVLVRSADGSEPLVADDQTVTGYGYHFSTDGESWAIVNGPDDQFTFSGEWSGNRAAELEAARKVAKAPFLWFTHQGKSYIVADPQIIAKIRAMYRPMDDLGRQQEALGKQQEELGKQMDELGRLQDGVQVKMPDLSKEMAELDVQIAKAKESRDQWNTKDLAEAEASLKAAQNKMLTPEKMADLQEKLADAQAAWNDNMAEMQARLAELQGRLGALEGEAGARQGEFGAKMGALGEQQGKLGEQQGRLGEEQGKLAQQADQKVRSIIDECLRNGKATQVPNVK